MGKVSFSAGIQEIKGKLGNIVFQAGRGSSTVRQLVIPANPNTSDQITRRNALSVRSKAWANLTEAQRIAWDNAAASGSWALTDAFGVDFNPSGEQLYLQLNLTIALVGGAAITSPPAKATFPALVMGAFTVNGTTPALSLAYTGTLGANMTLVISTTDNLSAGIMSPQNSEFRVITTSTSATPIDLTAAFQAKFVNPIVGKKVYVRLEVVSDLTGEKVLVGQSSAIAV